MSESKEDLKKAQKQPGIVGGGPNSRMSAPADKPKNFKKSISQLFGYLAQYKWGLIFTIIFAIASTCFTIASPKILGNMTNDIVSDFVAIKVYDNIPEQMRDKIPAGTTGEQLMAKLPEGQQVPDSVRGQIADVDFSTKPEMNYADLAKTAGILIALYILSAIFGFIQGWIINNIANKTAYKMRRELSEKINRLPLSYFDKNSYGDVLSRITNDVDTIGQSLSQSLTTIVTSIVTVIGILGMMLSISWEMTGIALLTIPMSMLFIIFITKKSQKFFVGQANSLGKLNGHIEENYAGHNVIKAFGREKVTYEQFKKHNEELYGHGWKAQFLSGLMFPVMQFVGNLGYVGVALLGGWLAINGKMSIGNIQAFIQYMQQFNQPIMQLSQIASVLQSTAAASERIFGFLSESEEPDTGCSEKNVLKNIKGEVEFKNVKFSYEKGKPIIKNFSAKIKPGQKVAIVGPTGAGKTTMVNLLMRFYDADSGEILIDGVNTLSIPRGDIRTEFGMVLQDTWLFNGTIKENLTYGNPKISDAEMKKIAKGAYVNHFVKSLEKGYNTILDEDADNISAGEKQLLTIARAMIADPPMLILDEATSSVDTRTEVLIQKAMDKLMHGRTSFVIAHRLSTIRNADLILVMDQGNIIEQGNHDELIKKNGFYAKLYNSQFEEN